MEEHSICGIKAAQATLTSTEIKHLVEKSIESQASLSAEDQLKVTNASAYRESVNELEKLRNGKLNVSGRAERIAELEMRIKAFQITDSQDPGPHHELDSASAVPGMKALNASITNIIARGPDYASYTEMSIGGKYISMVSSVLSLRQPFVTQPVAEDCLVLQFNGEIFNPETLTLNDTDYVMSLLQMNLKRKTIEDAVIETFAVLNGEYAFVLLDLSTSKIFFGKDFVGKRSLLFSLTDLGLQIGSVLNIPNAEECRGNTISVVDLQSFSRKDLQVRSTVQNEPKTDKPVENLYILLKQACLIRQNTIVPLQAEKLRLTSYTPADVAVLFSGGLDCTVVAALLAENYIESKKICVIDLLSVGFEHPRTGVSASESPDRKLSERSWIELSQRFASTCVSFRLVHVDVSYQEWLAHKKRVFSLISPCTTEMDLSIAIAFYFAARAQDCVSIDKKCDLNGSIDESIQLLHTQKKSLEGNREPLQDNFTFHCGYTSDARVLFSGLGADELYGGYSRHENLFNNITEEESKEHLLATAGAYNALESSLAHDIDVIYERNLGRDDRAMASWGKELRYPFLDEDVVAFSLGCIAPELKMKFWWETRTTKKGSKRFKHFERKHILRQVAKRIGLPHAASEIKRAIQFGARSAKLEVGQSKAKGTDRAA